MDMNYYVTNIKPEYLWFERSPKDGSGGRAYEFIETEDGRWGIPEDCIKEIDERYSKRIVTGMKEITVYDAMKADTAIIDFNKMEIIKDIKLKDGTI